MKGKLYFRGILATLLIAIALDVVTEVPVSSSAATPTYVQGAATYAQTPTSTTTTQAFSSNVTAGNALVVSASWSDTGSITATCSDSLGNTFLVATSVYQSAANQSLKTCYAINGTTGSDTVTVTYSTATTYRGLIVSEYSGLAVSNSVDVSVTNSGSAGTAANAMTTNAATTTATSGELVYAAFFGQSATSPGTGFTQRSAAGRPLSEDQVQVAAGSITATAAQSVTGNYQAMLVAFRPQATGPSATTALGQGNYTSGTSGVTNSAMSYPMSTASDTAHHRLFVADYINNRVLVYNTDNYGHPNHYYADNVLGQTTFTVGTGGTTSSTMGDPWGLAYDPATNRLFEADSTNNRVLVFDVTSITNGEAAVHVLGQSSMTVNPPGPPLRL